MSQIREALNQSKSLSPDERQATIRNRSSYFAFCALVFTFLCIALVSAARGLYVAKSTQILFVVAVIVFTIRLLHDEGAQFRVPFIMETKTSLDQPQAIRSLPWIILLSGLMITPLAALSHGFYDYMYWLSALDAIHMEGGLIIGTIISAIFSFLLAKWIKEGRIIAMTLLVLGCLANIPGYVSIIAAAYFNHFYSTYFPNQILGWNIFNTYIFPTGTVFQDPSVAIVNLMIYSWIVYVILRHWSRIDTDGSKYRREVYGKLNTFKK